MLKIKNIINSAEKIDPDKSIKIEDGVISAANEKSIQSIVNQNYDAIDRSINQRPKPTNFVEKLIPWLNAIIKQRFGPLDILGAVT